MFRGLGWLMLFGALGCGEPNTDGSDRQAYLAAVSAEPAMALASCGTIVAPELRGDCLVFSAQAAASDRQFHLAATLCAQPMPDRWTDECAFLVADTGELNGVYAAGWCATAGQYAAQCAQHAALRTLLDQAQQSPLAHVGREAELREWLEAVVDRLPNRNLIHREKVVRTVMAGVVSERWNRREVHPDLCGDASPDECGRAMEMTLDDVLAKGGELNCVGRPLNQLRDRLLWAPEASSMVLDAAKTRCGRLERGLW